MARLFLSAREFNFISDITKELIKDVVGQKVYYYPMSEIKTKTHGVYNEALQKVFDNPIEIEALVSSNFHADTKVDQFGVDAQYKIEIYVQYRDLLEKGITVSIGDYFSFSFIYYEISELNYMRNIYGMPDHIDGIKLVGTKVRQSQFDAITKGPTDAFFTDKDAIQDTFVQQRGFSENRLGITGDSRDLVKNGVLDLPLEGPREVSPAGNSSGAGPAFYDED
jgi:hypothetical protein